MPRTRGQLIAAARRAGLPITRIAPGDRHFYWRFPLAAMATYDKARDLESAQALRALKPTLLAVGHGQAVAEPEAALAAAVRHPER